MPTLFLIRHGENDYFKQNRLAGRLPGVHLNPRGREQAEALAESLANTPLKAIYSSPLERAVETAEPLAMALRMEVQLRPDLTDTDVGEWAGRSWKALRRTKVWKVISQTPSRFQFPGGETFVQTQDRVLVALEAIATAHARRDLIAIIFHADPIKLAVAHYIGLPLDHFQSLIVDPGSVSVLMIGESNARLAALNLKPPFTFPHQKK